MLTIRSEQMRALQRERLRRFALHASARLERNLPHFAGSAGALGDHVRVGVSRGVRYFSTEGDVARYVEIVMRHLGGFTEQPHPASAIEMIQSASIPAERRLENFERWAAARGSTNANG